MIILFPSVDDPRVDVIAGGMESLEADVSAAWEKKGVNVNDHERYGNDFLRLFVNDGGMAVDGGTGAVMAVCQQFPPPHSPVVYPDQGTKHNSALKIAYLAPVLVITRYDYEDGGGGGATHGTARSSSSYTTYAPLKSRTRSLHTLQVRERSHHNLLVPARQSRRDRIPPWH